MTHHPWRLDGVPEQCDCDCHRNPQIQHFAPCCAVCGKCGLRFSKGFDAHERSCDGTAASR